MLSNKLRNEKGISLVEVLASVAILSIVVLAFINISDYTLSANHQSEKSVEALRVAEEQLNFAREYYRVNKDLPSSTTVDAYHVVFQSRKLSDSIGYDDSEFGEEHVSLQGIIASGSDSQVLTVTVSWSD